MGSPTQLLVSWDPPIEPNGIILSYKVYCYKSEDGYVADGESPDSTLEALSSANEAILTGLTPYTYYSCHVTANTSIGEGANSSSIRARTDESSKIIQLYCSMIMFAVMSYI